MYCSAWPWNGGKDLRSRLAWDPGVNRGGRVQIHCTVSAEELTLLLWYYHTINTSVAVGHLKTPTISSFRLRVRIQSRKHSKKIIFQPLAGTSGAENTVDLTRRCNLSVLMRSRAVLARYCNCFWSAPCSLWGSEPEPGFLLISSWWISDCWHCITISQSFSS